MEFFNSAVDVLQTLVIALGAGLGIWGGINLMEGYGNDNPGAKSQGMKQLMAGGGVCPHWTYPCTAALRPVWIMPQTNTTRRALSETGGRGKGGISF